MQNQKRGTNKNVRKGDNNNRSKITHFFTSGEGEKTKNIGDSNSKDNSENGNKNDDFYRACLMEKVEVCAKEKNCHGVIDKLRVQRDALHQKLNNVRKAHTVSSKVIAKKDEEINRLRGLLKPSGRKTKILTQKESTGTVKAKKVLFETFKDKFTEEHLGILRSTSKKPRGDSTFVLNSVRFLFADNLQELQHKSLKGKGNKEQISPVKLNQLNSLFKERLDDMELKEEDRTGREKKFERHIHRAIMNINTQLKNSENKNKTIIVNEE